MRITLQGARITDAFTDLAYGSVVIEDGRILSVGGEAEVSGAVIDAAGMIIMPGFIDIHTHGGGGYSLHTTQPDEILRYCRWAAGTGVTGFLIGVVGVNGGMPLAQLNAATQAIQAHTTGAQPLGIHLEGPYISPLRRGAHPTSWLRTPSAEDTEQILAAANGALRLVAMAPELQHAEDMIRLLTEANVTVSIGHSDATYKQTMEAITHGVSHMTHCFNAMRPLHHREPGPLGAIMCAPQVFGEIIGDGVHVHPVMVDMMIRLLKPSRAVIITDAQAGAGLGDSAEFEFAGQVAHNGGGVALLSDGTLAGSILTMDQALRNILAMSQLTLSEAVGMLTWNPAQSVKAQKKGLLQPGFDADLAIFDASMTLQATICRGTAAYTTNQWRERASIFG